MGKKMVFVLVVSVGVLVLVSFLLFGTGLLKTTCGDDTAVNTCSTIKPYFCSNGKLIEKASVCGCSNLTEINGEKCISDYQQGERNVSLNYVLRGEQGEISLVVYKNLSDYLSGLPRYISSKEDSNATLFDFKVKSLDENQQRELLLPLVVEIQNMAYNKKDQARIAISIVQNIPFGNSNKTLRFGSLVLPYQRYPYEVLYDNQGVCGEKSELLVFILRELGYDSSFLYYSQENHEAVGIKCSVAKSFNNTGYCFVETTGPAIISDYQTEYVSFGKLISSPEIIPFEGDLSFDGNFYEFKDARTLDNIRERIKDKGQVNFFQHIKFQNFKEKYGLETFNDTYVF